MIRAVLTGQLDGVAMRDDPVFGVQVPESVPGVPAELLQPRRTWSDAAAYDEQARKLAGMFTANFENFATDASAEVRSAGPRRD